MFNSKFQTTLHTYKGSKWAETIYYACYATYNAEEPFAILPSYELAESVMQNCAGFNSADPCAYHRNNGGWIMADYSIINL